MKGFVGKQVSQNRELSRHFHRCMATLNDTIHNSDGRTVLYCPSFEHSSTSEASQNKEQVLLSKNVVCEHEFSRNIYLYAN